MSQVKLKIDANSRSIEIEADGDAFESVASKAEAILGKLVELQAKDAQSSDPASGPKGDDPAAETKSEKSGTAAPPKPARAKAGGKTANWKMVDLLDESGRAELKAFFNEKKPVSQNEQVAVLAVKLKELTKRDGFDGNELYTAFQIVGKKTPANLKAVLGNITTAGWGVQNDKRYVPNFKAEDVVKHDLPHKGEGND